MFCVKGRKRLLLYNYLLYYDSTTLPLIHKQLGFQAHCNSETLYLTNRMMTTSEDEVKMADLVKTAVQSCHETFDPQIPYLICFPHLNVISHLRLRNQLAQEIQTQAVLQEIQIQHYDHKDIA